MRKTPKYYLNKAAEFIGTKFNRLTVLSLSEERTKDRHILVNCVCDCGNLYTVKLSLLKSGHTQSCGCLVIESALVNIKKAEKVKFKREPKLSSAKRIFDRYYNDGADLSFEEFVELTQKDCFYCGVKPSNVYNTCAGVRQYISSPDRVRDGYFTYNGLDRVDNNLTHTKDNIVTCCEDCNRAKLERSVEEFFSWAHRITKLHPL